MENKRGHGTISISEVKSSEMLFFISTFWESNLFSFLRLLPSIILKINNKDIVIFHFQKKKWKKIAQKESLSLCLWLNF